MQAIIPQATTVDEIADGIYRISSPVPRAEMPMGFSFNQYLIAGDLPLLYHTGPRRYFNAVKGAIERIMPIEKLTYIGFSHVEADECGSLNDFLRIAPLAVPVCSAVAANVSIADLAIRPPKGMEDGELLDLGRHRLRWLNTPHVPHAWESAVAYEETTQTLLCGDLFTQPGDVTPALTDADILESSESFRSLMDYYAHSPQTRSQLERLAGLGAKTLACMHGSAYRGDSASLLMRLADRLDAGKLATAA